MKSDRHRAPSECGSPDPTAQGECLAFFYHSVRSLTADDSRRGPCAGVVSALNAYSRDSSSRAERFWLSHRFCSCAPICSLPYGHVGRSRQREAVMSPEIDMPDQAKLTCRSARNRTHLPIHPYVVKDLCTSATEHWLFAKMSRKRKSNAHPPTKNRAAVPAAQFYSHPRANSCYRETRSRVGAAI